MKYIVTQLPSYNHKLDTPFVLGETVYKLRVNDYGSAETDTALEGTPIISVTRDPNGGYPFQTIPLNCIQEVK